MYLLLFLHIVFMFGAVALHAGPQLLALVAARTGQAGVIPVIVGAWTKGVALVSSLFGLGAIFGVATGLAFGFNLLAPWLVIAYVLFIVSGAWSNAMTVRHLRLVAERLATGSGGAVSAAGADDASDLLGCRLTFVVGVDLLILAALVFDMTVKPFA